MRLARIIDAYGKTPEQDRASYVLLDDNEKPAEWLTEAQVTEAILRAQRPERHWVVVTKEHGTFDFPEAVKCELGQAYGVGPWAHRLWDKDGNQIGEFPHGTVHYVRQVSR